MPSLDSRRQNDKKSPKKLKEFVLDGITQIPDYNGLKDKNLGNYFNNRKIHKVLLETGIVTLFFNFSC